MDVVSLSIEVPVPRRHGLERSLRLLRRQHLHRAVLALQHAAGGGEQAVVLLRVLFIAPADDLAVTASQADGGVAEGRVDVAPGVVGPLRPALVVGDGAPQGGEELALLLRDAVTPGRPGGPLPRPGQAGEAAASEVSTRVVLRWRLANLKVSPPSATSAARSRSTILRATHRA